MFVLLALMLMLMLLRKWEQHKTNKRVRSSYVSAYAYVAGVLNCYAFLCDFMLMEPREGSFWARVNMGTSHCIIHEGMTAPNMNVEWTKYVFGLEYFLLSNHRRSLSWRPPKSGCRIYFFWVSSSSKCETDSNQTWTILEPVLTVLPCQIKAPRARAI